MQKIILQAEYKRFFIQIKEQVKSSQAKAALSVNVNLIHLYWTIGKLIVEKQSQYNWGTGVIEQLSLDLKTEFPNTSGFSPRNLHDTRRFYLFYNTEIMRQAAALFDIQTVSQLVGLNQTLAPESHPSEDESTILRQAVAQIPWGHNLLILNKVKDPAAALFYVCQTIENNWSRAVLTLQIEQNLFARQGKSILNFKATLPEKQALLAQQMLKDPYNFSFLTLEPRVQELELEKLLTEHITKFLLELGKGFAFIGRQYRFEVGDKDYAVDLLFYHIRLRCFIVIDLKTTAFEPEFTGR